MSNHVVTVLQNESAALAAQIAESEATTRDLKAKKRQVDETVLLLSANAADPAPKDVAAMQAKSVDGGSLRTLIEDFVRQGGGVKPADIKEFLELIGKPTPPNSILSTLSRLKLTDKSIYKADNGKWYPVATVATGVGSTGGPVATALPPIAPHQLVLGGEAVFAPPQMDPALAFGNPSQMDPAVAFGNPPHSLVAYRPSPPPVGVDPFAAMNTKELSEEEVDTELTALMFGNENGPHR